MNHQKLFLFVCLLGTLVSCQKPQDAYEAAIIEQGFIPYRAPTTSASVGTLIRGNANQFLPLAPADKCFPEDLNLTWLDPVDLPDSYKEFSVDFSADLTALTQNGNPTVKLNSSFKGVKTVDIKFGDAKVQNLDQINFLDYYETDISEKCKDYVTRFPFIVQALKVDTMSFTFKNEWGSAVAISTDNIGAIATIEAGVKWNIKDNMTLQITSPKYIGYKMAKLRAKDNGMIQLVANQIDEKGNFLYKQIKSLRQFFGI